MKELKFKPTNKTVDFFNEFSVIDNLSIEIMLNRVLCCAINKVPFDASIILLWYVIVCIDNLDNRQQNELIFSLIFLLICCTINDEFSIDNAFETLEMTYNDIVKTINVSSAKSDKDMEIPPKICYGEKIKVKLAPLAMKIKEYSKLQGIAVEEAIEKKIEEMSPYNPNKAEEIILTRFIYMVSTQIPIQVSSTIFLFISNLILNNEDINTHFEQYIEELKKNCIESMATSYKHRRIEELKEKIYK